MSRASAAGVAALAAFAAQVGPAATWLPPVRRSLAPSWCGPMPAGTLAISFDDGPHPEGTIAVLDELDRLGWPATFFLLGEQVRRFPAVAAEVVRRGHQVGLHGDAHRYLIGRSPRAARDDLHRAVDSIGEHSGRSPLWWRPPYGVASGPALVTARSLELRPMLWSAWGRDWRAEATPASVVADLAKGRLDGGTVLLHDSDVTSAPGSWRTTVAALPLLAEALHGRGLAVRPMPA
ncbi:MAG TPA: polysaccharide deacetylase family protein [Mycobacteriales bacterium]|nr:polysaccharide deacetylase family protein [Mycobacteriales bacterium]